MECKVLQNVQLTRKLTQTVTLREILVQPIMGPYGGVECVRRVVQDFSLDFSSLETCLGSEHIKSPDV